MARAGSYWIKLTCGSCSRNPKIAFGHREKVKWLARVAAEAAQVARPKMFEVLLATRNRYDCST